MGGQWLETFLKGRGLRSEDVPQVVVAFLASKYCLYGLSIGLALRWQPLRRLLLDRSQVVSSGGATGMLLASRQWRLASEAWDRARHHPGALRRGAAEFGTKCRSAQAHYRDVKGKFQIAGRELLSQQLRRRLQLHLRGYVEPRSLWQDGLRSWTSSRYWQLSDKLEKVVNTSPTWQAVSRGLQVDPKRLVLGLAEGTILYKCTFPLHAPLVLCIIVHCVRRRSGLVRADSEEMQSDLIE